MPSSRLAYLDSIKALGICFVILYHCNWVPGNSLCIRGVYASCVPLFFVVNGCLMLRKEYSIHNLLRKSGKLILIMFFWAFVSTAVYMSVSHEWNTDGCLKSLVTKTLTISKPQCNHLWFLKALITLNLFNPIVYGFIHGSKKRMVYLLVLLSLWTVKFIDIATSRFINPVHWHAAYSLLYYVLGFGVLDGQLFEKKVKTGWLIVLVILLICFQWGYNWLFLQGWFSSLNSEKMWLSDVVWDGYNAPFIVLLTITICLLFKQIRWCETGLWQFIGKNSLAIYVLQTPVQRLIAYLIPIGQWSESYSIAAVLLPVLTLFTSAGIAAIIQSNKYTRYLVTV